MAKPRSRPLTIAALLLAACAAPARPAPVPAPAPQPAPVIPAPPEDPVAHMVQVLDRVGRDARDEDTADLHNFADVYQHASPEERDALFIAVVRAGGRTCQAHNRSLLWWWSHLGNNVWVLRGDPRADRMACRDLPDAPPMDLVSSIVLHPGPQGRACMLFLPPDPHDVGMVQFAHTQDMHRLAEEDTDDGVRVIVEMVRGTNVLVSRLEPDAAVVRETALWLLEYMLPTAGTDALIELMSTGPDAPTRTRVASVLADVAHANPGLRDAIAAGFRARLDALLASQDFESHDEAMHLLVALARVDDPTLVPYLRASLSALRGPGDAPRAATAVYALVLNARRADVHSLAPVVASHSRGVPGAPVDPRQFAAMLAVLRTCGDDNLDCAAQALSSARSDEAAAEAAAIIVRTDADAGPAITRPHLLDALVAGLPTINGGPRGHEPTPGISRVRVAIILRALDALSPRGCDACMPALERAEQAFRTGAGDVARGQDVEQEAERLRDRTTRRRHLP